MNMRTFTYSLYIYTLRLQRWAYRYLRAIKIIIKSLDFDSTSALKYRLRMPEHSMKVSKSTGTFN
jgi:hypothetical protein